MITALVGFAWVMMITALSLLGWTVIHFTRRIDALEEELEAMRDGKPVEVSAQLGFALEDE